jgi:hypothetical protein
MAKASDSPRSAEQLKEVAIFLKQADRLVREGDYTTALEEIAKARGRDPSHLSPHKKKRNQRSVSELLQNHKNQNRYRLPLNIFLILPLWKLSGLPL